MMPQDSYSGAEARKYGLEMAQKLAHKIGAIPLSKSSNEFTMHGKRVTIRCAKVKTTDVGVTLQMLERIDKIIGAFECPDGRYELIEMNPTEFKMNMRDSKNDGKVGLVRRKKFQELGHHLGFQEFDKN